MLRGRRHRAPRRQLHLLPGRRQQPHQDLDDGRTVPGVGGRKKTIRKIPEFKRNCMLFFTRPPCSARTTPRSTPTAPTCRRCRTTSASSSPPGKSSPEARTLPAPPRWSSPPPPTLRSSARRRATSSWCSTPPAAWRRAPTGSSGSSRRPSGGYS